MYHWPAKTSESKLQATYGQLYMDQTKRMVIKASFSYKLADSFKHHHVTANSKASRQH